MPKQQTLLTSWPSSVHAIKCYGCLFQLAGCRNPLDCYNQPDSCSNTNFSPVLVQSYDCEFGCEQYVITDATGSIVSWRRGCANQARPKASHLCLSRNIFFLRHDQCWCHQDYCNAAPGQLIRLPSASLVCSLLLSLLLFIFVHTKSYIN